MPHRVAMPRMSRADAARLAQQLGAERKLSRAEIAGWQPLLDYCAGNPLTLRVIAGQAVKMGLRGQAPIAAFVQAVRSGEQAIDDADAAQGRDKSLGASLDYGFRNAFADDELPVIALLHLFQGTVDVDALDLMGKGEYALAEVQGKTKEALADLLERATETGLLTHLGATYYIIHPALSWFLGQIFTYRYDGLAGHSPAQAARRAWVEAVGKLGEYYLRQFSVGNRQVIRTLALEEANLLHARRLARRNGWWDAVTSAMQGLEELYGYQGRGGEWARLVAEIVPDFCTANDDPNPGREEGYTLVMGYRISLASRQEYNLRWAAVLQSKVIAWDRQQAAVALALPPDAPLDAVQRNRIRTLGVSVLTLGQILMEQGSADCVAAYAETVHHTQRIADSVTEAIAHFNLGQAYKNLPAIRDLDIAEAASQRSLDLHELNDALGRARCIFQIGTIHYARFGEARQQNAPQAAQLLHAHAAESHNQQALALCPASAIGDLGTMHGQLGNLYQAVAQTERARQHYEQAADYFEQTGNRYHAGRVRKNMATMYRDAAGREETPTRQQDLLRRGLAYAQASLRDFQHFQGRAAADEADARRLIERIEGALGRTPP